MPEDFKTFFSAAFDDKRQPYDYQKRLACGKQQQGQSESDWLRSSGPCESRLISVPTGLGKTAAVVLSWLWNRQQPNSTWPRRLVYCLPMRTLVEQTAGEAEKWITNLAGAGLIRGEHPKVHILMGGEETEPWDLHPERDAILIGTQDMLLSRALNRGYGMSRYRWPMHFGLLNNDCLWVLDETQLMGPGLSTACQLEAFRREGPGLFGSMPGSRSVTWYASATVNAELLKTREWRDIERPTDFIFNLKDEKIATSGPIAQRLGARKKLVPKQDKNFGSKDKQPDAKLIADIVKHHREMVQSLQQAPADIPRRTLIIVNTVDRAVRVYAAIKAALGENHAEDLLLMHSRFRPNERLEQTQRLKAAHSSQIVIATQVIEAGVDVSSAILWTEIAPLASIVQRLGRLNRNGEFNELNYDPQAVVLGIEAPDPRDGAKRTKEQMADETKTATIAHLPYNWEKCHDAFTALKSLKTDASPRGLERIQPAIEKSIERCPYSLQRHELLDFFDTDANLSLGFTDVSPFVRGTDTDTDFQVLWREWDGSKPDHNYQPDFQRQELCSVPFGKVKDARAILSKGWVWRGKEAGWISVRDSDVYPGMTILLPSTAGGYSVDAGWTGNEKDQPVSDLFEPRPTMSDEDMLSSLENGWRSISKHTQEVHSAFDGILRELPTDLLLPEERQACAQGIHWHDLGKNHASWRDAAIKALNEANIVIPSEHQPLAKFQLSDSLKLKDVDGNPKFTGTELKREITKLRRSFKPGIAHEVASALAFRQSEIAKHGPGTARPITSLLSEYLIMAHHGHVRKVLRDELPKNHKEAKDADSVRGIANGDTLEAVQIGTETLGPTTLSTDGRKMGRDADGNESYTRGVLRLLEHYGPFRLAYLESLFRAADIRASILAKDTPTA
ncbi:MAG: DEAD/DEAH box helicase [Prosthecobacter sp.]|jgi:CRISPR-associated endonuclease/helicase Cas3|uniref:type I-G CRISPR-associated helicase/endonuclease Cas3g n=1 Tax=Prosthecobacter sp. TaxID=1965333 RepID=UPI0019DD3354|nr:DEAD/DEAH box helicase [Prosthecobacter sp.]MBE2283335.1 DEAD/DEAH box helicase [Prosthecobacter sp.]